VRTSGGPNLSIAAARIVAGIALDLVLTGLVDVLML
jgi:hypothetical protein